MKSKKAPKKEIILKSDKSFDEMLEDAFNDKVLKKGDFIDPVVLALLNENLEKPEKKKAAKKAAKKSSKKTK